MQPLKVALRLLALLCPFGSALNAVQLNGFLTFLYGAVKVGLARLARAFVAYGVERNKFGEIVFVAVLLLQRAVNVGERSVIISVVTGVEGVPPTCLCCVFLRGASHCRRQHDSGNNRKEGYM